MTRHGENIIGMFSTMTPHKALVAFNMFRNSLRILKEHGVESHSFRGETGTEWTFEAFLYSRWITVSEEPHADR